MRHLAGLKLRDRLGRAAGFGHSEQTACSQKVGNDVTGIRPRAAHRQAGGTDVDDSASVDRNLSQFTRREKGDPSSIGGEEWSSGALGADDGSSGGLIDAASEQLCPVGGSQAHEDHAHTVGRDDDVCARPRGWPRGVDDDDIRSEIFGPAHQGPLHGASSGPGVDGGSDRGEGAECGDGDPRNRRAREQLTCGCWRSRVGEVAADRDPGFADPLQARLRLAVETAGE